MAGRSVEPVTSGMAKERMWELVVRKNPALAGGDRIGMSVKSVRRMYDVVWDAGYSAGHEDGVRSGNGVETIFGRIWRP